METADHMEQQDETEENNEEDQLFDINELLKNYDQQFSDLRDEDGFSTNLFEHPTPVDQQLEVLNEEFKLSLPQYVSLFDENIRDESLFVGAISLEEIQKEERLLREAHITFLMQVKEKEREFNEKLQLAEKAVKMRLAEEFKNKRRQLQMEKNALLHAQRAAKEEISAAFMKSEKQMIEKLEERKTDVKCLYGDMQMMSGVFTGPQNRRWKLDWSEAPQPMEIKIDCLRGVRDKLPRGRYVLFASLFSHLGGEILQWSKLPNQKWGTASQPVFHHGKFATPELMFEQSVHCILPSRKFLIPTMIVTIELFLLSDETHPVDTVVGWGVLPVCDSSFNLIQGKFKIPFLRGRMDRDIECHSQINNLMAHELDNWLANLYIEIAPQSRYLAGQSEFEVELQLSSQLLNFPERCASEYNEYRVSGRAQLPPYTSRWNKGKQISDQLPDSPPNYSPPHSASGYQSAGPSVTAHMDDDSKDSLITSTNPSPRNTDKKGEEAKNTDRGKTSKSHRKIRQPTTYNISRLILKEDSFHALSNTEAIEKFKPLKGHEGVYYKKNQRIISDDVQIDSFLPMTSRMKNKMDDFKSRVSKKTRLQLLEEYSFNIHDEVEVKGAIANANHRLQFFNRMILLELGVPNWRSSDLWILIFFLVLCWFLRLYLHYCGQWLFLTASGIPINNFIFHPHTVYLNYQWTLLTIPQEAAVVLLGPVFNIFVLLILMIISSLAQVSVHRFPNLISQFVFAFALMTLLDPLLILIVDCALTRHINFPDTPIADAAKLYQHFMLLEGSGIPGILLALIIYVTLLSISLCLIYIFLLRIHKKGRILDIYWRLKGDLEHFFLPLDMELSHEELSYHIRRARQWRGEEGERRRITVIDYEWQNDPQLDNPHSATCIEKTTYILIETISLDGLRQLHRHFLCLPDGAIIEILDLNVDNYFDHLKKATSSKPIRGNPSSPHHTDASSSELPEHRHPPPAKIGEALVLEDERGVGGNNYSISELENSTRYPELKKDIKQD